MALDDWLNDARNGQLAAFEKLVEATQGMVYAVSFRTLKDSNDAMDAFQETYVRAFANLKDIRDPAAFPGWLRRIALTTAMEMRRSRRRHLVDYCDEMQQPILNAKAETWTEAQRLAMAEAILTLSADDRLICERYYHGGWPVARLSEDAGITEAAMRKRLQRIREQLRKEIEMSEQDSAATQLPGNMPRKIIELLAKPRLTTLPENPVGRMWQMIQSHLPRSTVIEVAETVEDRQVQDAFGNLDIAEHLKEANQGLHRIDAQHFLRADITVPLMLACRGRSGPLSLVSAGKVYRVANVGPTRLEAFHQGEWLCVAEKLNLWESMGTLMSAIKSLFPGVQCRLEEVQFPLCQEAWELALYRNGEFLNVLGCGKYKDSIVQVLGNDPNRYGAFGVGFGLERLACMHFGIDDIRKVEGTKLA